MCTISQQVQKKQKTFCGLHFWKAWNLEHFEKKDEYPSLIFSEIMIAKEVVT